MTAEPIAQPRPQPDVVLELDLEGVSRGVTLSAAIPSEDVRTWIGRPWLETVVDPGRAKIRHIVHDAASTGVSGFRQVNQLFPSGLELPLEYTAERVGRKGLLAVGKSLQAVAELHSRLNAAQQTIERDYWKLRDIETRCRLLFDRSNEGVLLVRAADLSVLEANPAARRALGRAGAADERPLGELLPAVAPEERAALSTMLERVHDQGKAPGILLHLGEERRPWLVRASLLPSQQQGLAFLLQIDPAGEVRRDESRVPLEALVERSPDAFVALDTRGTILGANRAFLDLIQVGSEGSAVGEPLGRWLGRPGADMTVLLSNVTRHGAVRLFATTLQGELGSATEVEVSAAGDRDPQPRTLGVLIRDVGSRLQANGEVGHLGAALGAFTDRIGRSSLPRLVKEAVGLVERHYIEAALELTGGNRTAAAQLLGVSRQSLHAKLNRYAAEDEAPLPPPAG